MAKAVLLLSGGLDSTLAGALLVRYGTTGPSVLCRGVEDPGDVAVAAGIMAAYTKGGIRIDVEVRDRQAGDEPEIMRDVQPIDRAAAAGWRVGATSSRPTSEVMQT